MLYLSYKFFFFEGLVFRKIIFCLSKTKSLSKTWLWWFQIYKSCFLFYITSKFFTDLQNHCFTTVLYVVASTLSVGYPEFCLFVCFLLLFFFFVSIGFNSMRRWTATIRHGVTTKRRNKVWKGCMKVDLKKPKEKMCLSTI